MTRTIHILNTSIIPPGCDGVAVVRTISLPEAQGLIRSGVTVVSHVGHAATAEYASQALGVPVPMDRTPWDGSGEALVVQINGRPPEGKILTVPEMEAFGVVWRTLVIFPHSSAEVVPVVAPCPAEYALPVPDGCVDLGPVPGFTGPVLVPGHGWCLPEQGSAGMYGSHLFGRIVMPRGDG